MSEMILYEILKDLKKELKGKPYYPVATLREAKDKCDSCENEECKCSLVNRKKTTSSPELEQKKPDDFGEPIYGLGQPNPIYYSIESFSGADIQFLIYTPDTGVLQMPTIQGYAYRDINASLLSAIGMYSPDGFPIILAIGNSIFPDSTHLPETANFTMQFITEKGNAMYQQFKDCQRLMSCGGATVDTIFSEEIAFYLVREMTTTHGVSEEWTKVRDDK